MASVVKQQPFTEHRTRDDDQKRGNKQNGGEERGITSRRIREEDRNDRHTIHREKKSIKTAGYVDRLEFLFIQEDFGY